MTRFFSVLFPSSHPNHLPRSVHSFIPIQSLRPDRETQSQSLKIDFLSPSQDLLSVQSSPGSKAARWSRWFQAPPSVRVSLHKALNRPSPRITHSQHPAILETCEQSIYTYTIIAILLLFLYNHNRAQIKETPVRMLTGHLGLQMSILTLYYEFLMRSIMLTQCNTKKV